jgi:hypothetical protein
VLPRTCTRVESAEVRGWIKSTIEARLGDSEPIRDSGARTRDSGGSEYSLARGIHGSAASAAGSQQALAPLRMAWARRGPVNESGALFVTGPWNAVRGLSSAEDRRARVTQDNGNFRMACSQSASFALDEDLTNCARNGLPRPETAKLSRRIS